MTARATATVPTRTAPAPSRSAGRATVGAPAPARPQRPVQPGRRQPPRDQPTRTQPARPKKTASRRSVPRQAGRLGARLLLPPPPAASSAPRTPFVVLILGLVIAGMVCLLLLNTAVNQNSFQLNTLQRNQKVLDLKEQGLHQDVNQLQAPGTLAAAARRLGWVPAGQPAFIRLPDGRILGVPTPAKDPTSSSDGSSDSNGSQPLVPPANSTGTPQGGQPSTPPSGAANSAASGAKCADRRCQTTDRGR
ncbi:hypothetical protein [Fodinicola feengrottensis]|uniref:hypothetical protein n=1 Tax=Fodinicola feengrottensis TaxID=435914 RepID=UPI0013D3278B|nr:hypothetical protein [Fodinicola feengrottensis]